MGGVVVMNGVHHSLVVFLLSLPFSFLSFFCQQEKLSSLHARNQQQLKESRKLALIGNAARYQQEAANNMY